MTVSTNTLSLLTKLFLMVVSADVVNGACQPSSRDYQMHQGNTIAFYPSLMQDHTLKDTIYQVIKASSDVLCAVHCLQDDSCKSFNYCDDKVCQLKAANYSVSTSETQLTPGCRHYNGDEELQTEETKFEGTSICAQNTHRLTGLMELQLPMTSPVRLEFTVNNTGGFVTVHFSPSGPGTHEALFRIEFGTAYGKFFKRTSFSQVFELVHGNGFKYIGVPVIMTYDNGCFEMAVQGVPDSTLKYDVTSQPQSWFVSFDNQHYEADIIFSEPCINDFNPKFTPY